MAVYDIGRDYSVVQPLEGHKPAIIYRVYGNGAPMPREFKTYGEALTYVRSDAFAKECPIWTPMTISLCGFFAAVIVMMIAMGVH